MKGIFKKLLISIQFLTRLPIPLKGPYGEKELGRSLLYSPLTGLLIGGLLLLLHLGGQNILPTLPLAIVIVFFYVFLTGGLHLDGVGDVCDGLFSYRKGEEMLAIMKDSRLGTFGFLGLFFLLILLVVAVYELLTVGEVFFLLLFPAVGRVAIIVAAAFNNYIKGKEGMAKSYLDYTHPRDAILPVLFIGGGLFLLLSWWGLIAYAGALLIGYLLSKWCQYRLGGINGDVLGFVCEWSQVVFLLIYLGGVVQNVFSFI